MRSAIPVVEQKLCTGCEQCAEACEAKAIKMVSEKARIEYEKCYSYNGRNCRACVDACPRNAIGLVE